MVKKAAQAIPNKRLWAARQERGWTQQQLADLIGAPQPLNVTRWERGVAFPSAYYTQKLAQVFEKSPRDLGLLPPEGESEEQQEHVPAGTLWQVPYRRNPFFTGREDLLHLLRQQLSNERCVALTQSYALTGLGGIGKTQTALEYAHRYQQDYRAVFWTRAASREMLAADYGSLARLLELPESDAAEQSKAVEAVKRWLLTHLGWLLVLDNMDDLDLVADFVPTTGQGHLLLTTRAQASGKLALGIVVETMATEEACLLLLRRARRLGPTDPLAAASLKEREAALAIVQELDGLPLALDQAGAYIEEVGSSLREYLLLYQHHQTQLLGRQSALGHDYPYTVANTWSLSFRQVEQASPAAADLLRLCAFLAPDAIPELILSAGAAALGPALSPVAADPFLLGEAVQVLRRFSLIRRDGEAQMLVIHRLVQAVLKQQIDEPTRSLWVERAARAVHAAFPAVAYETWPRCQQCLPHAMACAALLEEHRLAFLEAAQLLDRAGEYLLARGLYSEAVSVLQQALGIEEQLTGPEHPARAAALDRLALGYQAAGKYEQAEELQWRALAIREHALGPEHPDTVTTYFNLDWTYYLQGKYEQAEAAAQRALEIRERALGPEHPDTLDVYGDLGLIYLLRGKYEQAEDLLQRGLTLYEQTRGPDDPDINDILNNLAVVYLKQGNYEQAEPLLLRTLASVEKIKGPEHPYLVRPLDNLARVYQNQGRYEQTEACFRRALALSEQAWGPEHPDTALVLNYMGRFYSIQRKDEQAETLLRRALSICEQALGPAHPETATTLSHLAQLYQLQGCYEDAEPLLRRALSIREQALGSQHPDTMTTRSLYQDLQQEVQQLRRSTEEKKQASTEPSSPKAPAYPARLSEREVQVLGLATQGLTNAQIAERLALSEKTVINHLTRMFKKMGCHNRATAVAFAIRHGIT